LLQKRTHRLFEAYEWWEIQETWTYMLGVNECRFWEGRPEDGHLPV